MTHKMLNTLLKQPFYLTYFPNFLLLSLPSMFCSISMIEMLPLKFVVEFVHQLFLD